MENVYVVENSVKAKEKIDQLTIQGYTKDEIYVVAHEPDQTDKLSENLHVNQVGMEEEGVLDKIANVFRSRGDELRNQFENLGLSAAEADRYEAELDKGHFVIIAKK
ncbi:general stress protein [Oceanobacillus alkalisoli]|uniref:general stress protein n=1 Tax=Oceanobacillus alkalisoli TaxID=2925113 RepID=UPI001EEFF6E3|nr:general stress protein [Oceanobacillus alkalisoli]MCF3945015.1 general stress protein [Oceanobacillus alkalisoli]MCG5105333.1 general stress protein [Oceanobacillus alkalisoli]